MSVLFSMSPTFFLHCVHTSVFYICIFIPSLQVGLPEAFF